MIPGSLAWGFLLFLVATIFWLPTLGAILIITFDLYWVFRVGYLSTLLVIAHFRLLREEKKDWLKLAEDLQSPHGQMDDFYHAVIFPTYKETPATLEASLEALKQSRYDLKRVIPVIATEARGGNETVEEMLRLRERYRNVFREILVTNHPDHLPGEARVKGANASWAAKELQRWIEDQDIPVRKVILSCFDADTVCHPQYLACLTFSFLNHPNPYQASFQPIPMYHNNIWYAPSFARVVEVSSSFWQLVQSMRRDKLVTFSSHAMAFKTLCEIDFWPRDMVSDDSAIFWKALLHFDGNYQVVPIYVTVSMDVTFDKGFFRTVINQYRQKRRWAWGVENFPMVMEGFRKRKNISWIQKMKRTFQLLEEHFTWATWALVLALIGPLPILFGSVAFQDSVLGFNLPGITRFLLSVTSISLVICILASFSMLPPKPKNVPPYRIFSMCTQWLLIPFISAVIGSLPALDAQTRLMTGRMLNFWVTPKRRVVTSNT